MYETLFVTVITVVTVKLDVCIEFAIATTPTVEWTVLVDHLERFHLDLKLYYFLHSSFTLRTFSRCQIKSSACTLNSLHRFLLACPDSACKGVIIIFNIQTRTEMLNLQV